MRTRTSVVVGIVLFHAYASALAAAQTAPTCSWTDNPIVAGQTPIKAEHVNEIRACLDSILANWPVTTPPPPPPEGSCTDNLGLVSGTVTRSGFFESGCPSAHLGDKFARYYTFMLTQESSLTIDLTSSLVDTYLILRNGAGTGIELVAEDDDSAGGTNARITGTFGAGTYTIEATTLLTGVSGSFMLTLSTSIAGGARQVTLSDVQWDHESTLYAVSGTITNTGIETIRGWTTWVRFHRADASLISEERDFSSSRTLLPGDRTQFRISFIRGETHGRAYYQVSIVGREGPLSCIGCETQHQPPPPQPCGIPFDEALATAKQCSNGLWTASGSVQLFIGCGERSEQEALDLVTADWQDGFFLELIGTADFDLLDGRTSVGRRLWRAGYTLRASDNDMRDLISNISCTP